jgi:predicted small secreted protein
MTKRALAFFILCAFIVLLLGCETIKGAGQGTVAGAKKDWQALKKADGWLKKNAW